MAPRASLRDSVPSVTASIRPQHVGETALTAVADAVRGVTMRDLGGGTTVTGVCLDSRVVRPGDLYAALPGARAHGADFVGQALRAGARAVLTDPAGAARIASSEPFSSGGQAVPPLLVADDPRCLLGAVSAFVYGRPADDLTMIGITGTNGKTTTAYLIEAALRAAGRRTGLIGTIETRIGTDRLPSVRTTPEASDLHGLLAVMAERGCDVCCMEVSSHALALHRVDAVRYDIAIFLNLSQDHLDFHGTMEEYFAAKAALFTPERARRGIVCVDDEWGRRLATGAAIGVTTMTTLPHVEADWRILPGVPDGDGDMPQLDEFRFAGPRGVTLSLRSCLPGGHNRTNTALAALALLELGLDPDQVERAIAAGAQVPGRMQSVDLGGPAPLAVVDFAHTPQAVAATVAALRGRRPGPLVVVLGAGGDRDPGKRAAMGMAAAQGVDAVVVTDDNPRHEDPAQIRAAVAAGARSAGQGAVYDVPGRSDAIDRALRLAIADGQFGTVAVLGKGHEQGQTIGDTTTPFDDALVLRTRWAAVAAGSEHDARGGLTYATGSDREVHT